MAKDGPVANSTVVPKATRKKSVGRESGVCSLYREKSETIENSRTKMVKNKTIRMPKVDLLTIMITKNMIAPINKPDKHHAFSSNSR